MKSYFMNWKQYGFFFDGFKNKMFQPKTNLLYNNKTNYITKYIYSLIIAYLTKTDGKNIDINELDASGETALYKATRSERRDTVELLLENSADPNK